MASNFSVADEPAQPIRSIEARQANDVVERSSLRVSGAE